MYEDLGLYEDLGASRCVISDKDVRLPLEILAHGSVVKHRGVQRADRILLSVFSYPTCTSGRRIGSDSA